VQTNKTIIYLSDTTILAYIPAYT